MESNHKLLDLIEELKQEECPVNPKLPQRSSEKWDAFFRWLDDKSDRKLSEKVDVAAKYDEFGLVAKVPFKKGDVVLDLHRKLMLSTETVKEDSSLYSFVLDDPIASTMQNVVLVLHLLNEYSKGDKSAWHPYLSILPSKLLPVLSMTRAKFELLLASSHIFESLKMIRAIARQYSYFYKRLQATKLPLAKDFTFEYYCWGVSIVCSRQNEIPPSNRKAYPLPANALIPLLDMCNHERQSNQATFEKDSSLLLASSDLQIGDDITINYGNRSSGEFYIHNGFVPNDVPFDIVPITITLNQSDPLYVTRVKLLKILNMPSFGRFKLIYSDHKYRHKRDPHLTMFLIVYFLNEDELDHLMDDPNPVGIADKIYEYIQYGQDNQAAEEGQTNDDQHLAKALPANDAKDEGFNVEMTEKRLASCIREYLSKRASIGIALIDRTLGDESLDDKAAATMLRHERSVFESYLLRKST